MHQNRPAGGAYSAPPDPLAGFKVLGPTSKGRGYRKGGEGRGRGRQGGEEGEGRVREGRERRGPQCVSLNFP